MGYLIIGLNVSILPRPSIFPDRFLEIPNRFFFLDSGASLSSNSFAFLVSEDFGFASALCSILGDFPPVPPLGDFRPLSVLGRISPGVLLGYFPPLCTTRWLNVDVIHNGWEICVKQYVRSKRFYMEIHNSRSKIPPFLRRIYASLRGALIT